MNRNIQIRSRSIALAMSLMMIGLAACGGAAPAAAPTAAPTSVPAATAVPPTEAPAPTAEPTVAPTEAPTEAPAATAAPTAAPTATAAPTEAPAAAAAAVFKIDGARSKASFTLDEKLLGNPVTVVGVTTDVQGEITFSAADLSQTKVGTLQINARTFKTDSSRRDGAISRFILQTTRDEYQFITFESTGIEGLPASAKVGEALSFKITGNLKVRDVVKPVTFETTATLVSDTELSGSAVATVLRSDFGLQIPSVPSVADVTDAVKLQLDFVAVP
jgi:polyisoprenoid-binding protein YceI